MSLISASVPNMINGVSQQPFMQRLTSQGELQINGYSSLVEGLRKRPPSTHIAKLRSTSLLNAYLHTIDRDLNEQYKVILDGSTIQVFDLLGNARTVTTPNGTAYITDPSPQTSFAATTVADYTFILNKNTTVTMDPAQVAATRPYEALVWIRASNYSSKYSLTVGGRLATKTTKDNSASGNLADIQTTVICNDLYIMLTTGSTAGTAGTTLDSVTGTIDPTISIQNLGSSLYISGPNDFTVTASDAHGDTDMVVVKGTINSFTNLPARGKDGFVVKVSSQGGGQNDGYWVKYKADANNPYGGSWIECTKPGEQTGLLASTMPHILVRNADGTFTFKEATWTARTAGDITFLPLPSFVGATINDVFFYQGRLGFLSGENVVTGVTSDTFNMFRQTALQVLDTDPVDLASTTTTVSTLKAAIPFQGSLLLFSDLVQFQLAYTGLMSPKTVEIVQVTDFETSLLAKPVGAGPNVYFAVPKGNYVGVREYYLDGTARVDNANDVTSHVPSYIPGKPIKLAIATNENCLAVLADGDQTSVFVYRYYWEQTQKMQSSWSQWKFSPTDTILNIDFIQNKLYLVVSRSDGVYLESINIQPGLYEANSTLLVHLDRKVANSQTTLAYNATTGLTTVTMPYAPTDWTKYQCVAWVGDATYDFGRLVPITTTGASTFTVPGRLTSFFVGRTYTFQYRFSKWTVREPVPMTYTQQAVTEGRLQLRNALVNYANTGYFRVVVTPFARDPSTYVFSGVSIGVASSVLGSPSLGTGVFKFPVQCQNLYATIDIINDSYLPCFFESAGWEGFFVLRSRRM